MGLGNLPRPFFIDWFLTVFHRERFGNRAREVDIALRDPL